MEEKKTMGYVEACSFIKDYIKTTGKSQREVASEIGFSGSALSGYLAGTYSAPHTITAAIEELAEISRQKKVAPKSPEYAETSISREVTNAIRYAHLQGNISVVYGDAGIGKTMAARNYLEHNTRAVGITISPTFSSITGVNEKLSEQLGVRERISRRQTMEIISKLRGSGRVVVIDEAQHLTVRALEHLRCISDESGVGICFIGNDAVYSKLKGSGQADFAQLFSRIGMRRHVLVNSITKKDVEDVFGKYVADEEAMKILLRICRTNYGMRGAVNAFINAAASFEEITGAGLTAAMREMNIG